MSFPYHDPYWVAVADWVRARAAVTDRILAPDIFWWRFQKIHRYRDPFLRPDATYDWAILHKGLLHELPQSFLERLVQDLQPVFANEVFVVWGNAVNDGALDRRNPDVDAFFVRLRALDRQNIQTQFNIVDESVLPDPGSISQFSALSDVDLVAAMDAFWTNGGYIYSTARDKAYYKEIDRYIAAFVGDAAGRVVLDLCCGRGRLGQLISDGTRVIGIDVSSVAIEKARADHRGRDNLRFELMDAHCLQFPDQAFDDVLFVDSIEHVREPQRVLEQAARVLRPGGRLLVSVANRDSVNQILTRKLGYAEFVTNYQHIREFAFSEAISLFKQAGFSVVSTAGIFLYPYWGVPGIDGIVRHIQDEDPEFVELMRRLGERIGAEYAYTSIFQAHKLR